MTSNLQDFIDSRLIPAVYADPSKLFGGTWKQKGARKVCAEHLLTDGHRSHDGNGSFISNRRPHLVCDGGDPRTNTEAVKYIETAKGYTRVEAARYIADVYGLIMPDLEPETPEAKQRRERRAHQRRIAETMKLADGPTLTPGQQEALGYLHRRGMTDQQIDEAGIVYISTDPSETEANTKLKEIWATIQDRVKPEGRPGGVWPTETTKAVYRLAWPVWSMGKHVGYSFGVLPSDMDVAKAQDMPKYKLARFDDSGPVVFGLRPARSTRYPWQARTLVAAEGYFDGWSASRALHGTETPDVVAYIEGSINDGQAQAIHQAGYNRVILIPDWEGETRTIALGAKLQADHIESSAAALRRAGVSMYVADLCDADHPETKQDANSFVGQYGVEDFRDRVAEASTVAQHAVWTAYHRFGGEQVKTMAMAEVRDYITRAIAEEADPVVAKMLATDPVTASVYAGDLSAAEAAIKAERIKVDQERAQEAADLKRMKCAEAYREAASLISDGNEKEAERAIRRAQAQDGPDIMATTFAPQSLQVFDTETPDIPGIPTPYHLHSADGVDVPLVIKEEAITTFGARSGHGKTAMLLNLAVCCLDAVGDQEAVAYFTAETSRKSLAKRLYNILAGRKGMPLEQAQSIIDHALQSGKLLLFRDRDAGIIRDRVEALGSRKRVRAVIVDYIQLLRVAGFKGNKKERMEEACSVLEAMAVSTSAAVIIGAQLNRAETKDPISWGVDSIGDAIDIEQVSSDIFLLWNTGKKPTGERTMDSINTDLRQAGIQAAIGVKGSLIVRCIKARDEHLGNGGDAIWTIAPDCSISQRPTEQVQATRPRRIV